MIWVSAGEFCEADTKLGPRIKVVPGAKTKRTGLENTASVTISAAPLIFGDLPATLKNQAIDFVKSNRKTLLQYWRNEVSTREMIDSLKKIR